MAEKHKYEWDNIKDPVEKQNAILAKYGLKPRKLASELDREEEEMDDILNYECSEDVNRCKTKLNFYPVFLKQMRGMILSGMRKS